MQSSLEIYSRHEIEFYRGWMKIKHVQLKLTVLESLAIIKRHLYCISKVAKLKPRMHSGQKKAETSFSICYNNIIPPFITLSSCIYFSSHHAVERQILRNPGEMLALAQLEDPHWPVSPPEPTENKILIQHFP